MKMVCDITIFEISKKKGENRMDKSPKCTTGVEVEENDSFSEAPEVFFHKREQPE